MAAGTVDTNHGFTIVSGCLNVPNAGLYSYSADLRATPNKSDDADPTDQAGPHRITPTWEVRRTRGVNTITLPTSRNSTYIRGYTAGQTPASNYVNFDGVIVAQANDRYCVYVDATAAEATQADYLTIDNGTVLITSQRIQ